MTTDDPTMHHPAHQHRVVLTSMGEAGFAHLPVLGRLVPAPGARLAELLLQAPSELIRVGDRDQAEQVARLLGEAGLVADVLSADDEFEPGVGRFDVAVHVRDVERTRDVIAETARLLGVSATEARDIVCASPPLLLGKVSQATVDALTDRYARVGAELGVSDTATARFDVVVADCPPRVRTHLRGLAGGAAVDEADDGPMLVVDLDRATAETMLRELARMSTHAKVVDRAFERFDVRLVSCPDDPRALRCLVELTGMPAEVAPGVVAAAPLVLLEEVGHREMEQALAELAGVGATGVGDLTTLRRWAVRIHRAPGGDALGEITEAITGRSLPDSTFPIVVDDLPSRVQARWLATDLERIGAATEVLIR